MHAANNSLDIASQRVYVANVLIHREASITYRDNVVLEYAWHEEVGAVGLNHIMVYKRLAR